MYTSHYTHSTYTHQCIYTSQVALHRHTYTTHVDTSLCTHSILHDTTYPQHIHHCAYTTQVSLHRHIQRISLHMHTALMHLCTHTHSLARTFTMSPLQLWIPVKQTDLTTKSPVQPQLCGLLHLPRTRCVTFSHISALVW